MLEAATTRGARAASKRVLVLGGSPSARARLARALAFRGYRVIECPSGRDVVEMARRERPELVIVQYPISAARHDIGNMLRSDPKLNGIRILDVIGWVGAQDTETVGDAPLSRVEPARIVSEVKELIGPAIDP